MAVRAIIAAVAALLLLPPSAMALTTTVTPTSTTDLVPFPDDDAPRVYLVAVGIADYPGTANDLSLPVRDAETIVDIYSKNIGMTYSLLKNEKATLKNIRAAMRKVYKKARVGDIVVFFYSGHGYPGGFVAYDGRLTYGQVRKWMAVSKCRKKIIFADACFAGAMQTPGRASQSAVTAAKNAEVMLFLSSRPEETSIENPGMKNGFFTTFLQQGLRGGADKDRNRTITARELYEYVHSGVIDLSGKRQHPVMWGKFDNNMTVIQW